MSQLDSNAVIRKIEEAAASDAKHPRGAIREMLSQLICEGVNFDAVSSGVLSYNCREYQLDVFSVEFYRMAVFKGNYSFCEMWESFHNFKPWIAYRSALPGHVESLAQQHNTRIAEGMMVLLKKEKHAWQESEIYFCKSSQQGYAVFFVQSIDHLNIVLNVDKNMAGRSFTLGRDVWNQIYQLAE